MNQGENNEKSGVGTNGISGFGIGSPGGSGSGLESG
jgi:hypothetical protein